MATTTNSITMTRFERNYQTRKANEAYLLQDCQNKRNRVKKNEQDNQKPK